MLHLQNGMPRPVKLFRWRAERNDKAIKTGPGRSDRRLKFTVLASFWTSKTVSTKTIGNNFIRVRGKFQFSPLEIRILKWGKVLRSHSWLEGPVTRSTIVNEFELKVRHNSQLLADFHLQVDACRSADVSGFQISKQVTTFCQFFSSFWVTVKYFPTEHFCLISRLKVVESDVLTLSWRL